MGAERSLPFSRYRAGLRLSVAAWTLLAAGFALGEPLGPVAGLGGALLLALASRELRSRLGLAAAVLAGAFTLYSTAPALAGTYRFALVLEALLAALPLVVLAFARVGGHAARRAARSDTRVPLLFPALLAAAVGTAVRAAEIGLLWDQPGTLATVRYALRGDLAETFWALAAFATAGSYLYAAHVATERSGRDLRRVAVGALAALLLFSFVGYDVGTAAAAAAHGPVGIGVGLHADHLDQLPADVKLAHLEVPWALVEPAEGARDWSFYDAQVRLAEERGIGLYLLANTYPPAWLVRREPESVMVDQRGEPFTWIDETPGAPRERVWDLSFADADVVELKRAFLRAAVDRYAGSPAVRWIAVQNEPAYPFDWSLVRYASYDNLTVDDFRGWLRARYGALAALNENASGEWETWDEVEAPTHPFAGLWSDWMTYREETLIAFVEGLVDAARPYAHGKPLTVKIMAHGLTRFAVPQAGLTDRVVRAFANASDVVSLDLYPASLDDLRRQLDYYEDVADGKPIVVAEFNLLLGTNLPTGGARLVNALLALDGRAQAVFLFTGDEHWLYGFSAHARSPGFTALALAREPALSGAFPLALSTLLVEDALAVQNVYHVYALGMVAAGLPVLPWPVLLLASAPVPVGGERARWGILAAKAAILALAAALAL